MPQTKTVVTADVSYQPILKLLLLTAIAFSFMIGAAFAGSPSTWKNQEYKVKGTWAIESRADGNYLVLSDDFKTRSAPDLKFFLTKQNYEAVNGRNATNGAVLISALSSTKGGASYKIPSNVNLADYESLILHCEQYSKLWASTPLK